MAQPFPLAFSDLQIYSWLLRALPQLAFILFTYCYLTKPSGNNELEIM
jgi:hypothetical protein